MVGAAIGYSVNVGHFSLEELALCLSHVWSSSHSTMETHMSKTYVQKSSVNPQPRGPIEKSGHSRMIVSSLRTILLNTFICLLWKPCAKCVGIST